MASRIADECVDVEISGALHGQSCHTGILADGIRGLSKSDECDTAVIVNDRYACTVIPEARVRGIAQTHRETLCLFRERIINDWNIDCLCLLAGREDDRTGRKGIIRPRTSGVVACRVCNGRLLGQIAASYQCQRGDAGILDDSNTCRLKSDHGIGVVINNRER